MFDTLIHRWLRVPYLLHVRTERDVKKPRATILFLHGIGSSAAEWEQVIEQLPDDVSIVAIDMLGFGKSPRPTWAKYNAREQARSVIATLLQVGFSRHLIVVGHSLGALVAVEVAKRYPLLVRSLVLCSPPFYRGEADSKWPTPDQMLKRLFQLAQDRQDNFVKLATFATRYKLVNPAFQVTAENVESYLATLRGSIMSQTAFEDAKVIKKPVTIIYGSLDPLVIDRNIKAVAAVNSKVKTSRALVGHEITGRYVPSVVRHIKSHINRTY